MLIQSATVRFAKAMCLRNEDQSASGCLGGASETVGMISQRPRLAECPLRMVRFAYHRCHRRGQYRKETLIAKFGDDALMLDRRHLVANCPCKHAPR